METTDAPQILEHINQSVTFTPYETRWIPCSARCVVMGLYPRGTGVLQVWELDKGEFKVIKEVRVRLTCVADRAHAPFVCSIIGSFPDHWGCVERDLALPSLSEWRELKFHRTCDDARVLAWPLYAIVRAAIFT